jgi:hypothetical protein
MTVCDGDSKHAYADPGLVAEMERHRVSLDNLIAATRQTRGDMQSKYNAWGIGGEFCGVSRVHKTPADKPRAARARADIGAAGPQCLFCETHRVKC